MINRLMNLKVKDFRVFTELVDVSLASDIVLIYGPNGSGKSSLINAIEVALTGGCEDLAIFKADYPRSLINVSATKAEIVLDSIISGKKSEINATVSSKVSTDSPIVSTSANMFRNRSYLSQSRLQKILDIYAKFDDSGLGGVGFLKALFGSEVLDHTIDGLTPFGNKRTLANKVDIYAQIDKKLEERNSHLLAIKDSLRNRQVDSVEELSKIKGMLVLFFPNQLSLAFEPTPASVSDWLKRIENLEASENPKVQLSKLRQIESTLNASTTILSKSGGQDEIKQIEAIGSKIRKIEEDLTTDEFSLNKDLVLIEDELAKIDLYPYLEEKPKRVDKRAQILSNALKSRKVEFIEASKQLDEFAQTTKQLEAKHKEINDNLNKLNKSILTTNADRLISALNNIASQLDGNQCPVCDRDFSDTGSDSLVGHLRAKLTKLGADAENFRETTKRFDNLGIEKNQVENQLEIIRKQVSQIKWSKDKLDTGLSTAIKLVDQADSLSTRIEKVSKNYHELVELKTQRSLSETKLKQYSESIQQIEDVASSLGIDISNNETVDERFWTPIQEEIAKQVDANEQRLVLLNRIQQSLSSMLKLTSDISDQKAKEAEIQNAINRLMEAREKSDRNIELVRSIRKKAVSAKEEIYKKIFSETLNNLYANIFMRLVDSEKFLPAISEPQRDGRGNLFSGIKAMLNGEEAFSNAKSVLSAGHVSTAALSLFLTLNIMEQSSHNILVLDDPVQSMDDVKVSQLAKTIRAINAKLNRQVILAIHERPLYQDLKLELSPKNPEETLQCVELEFDGKIYNAESKQITWSKDRVELRG